jgi:retron-type reverse transcriptase
MKRYGNLYSKIITIDNLYKAAKKAEKGKRYQSKVAGFNFLLEPELLELQKELTNRTYQPGKYHSFDIHVPKKRMISAAPYEDRVVHHALCNIVMPLFEKSFIADSYANRKGKGTHAAILKYQQYAKQYQYVLKCDIRKFFPSIDHEILKQLIRKKIKCKDTIALMDKIIDNSNPQEEHIIYFKNDNLFTPMQRRRGLPIGNLTSQWFGNIYMNEFDHFIKNKLSIKGYIRYVDDFVIFSNSKIELAETKQQIINFLSNYRLILHPNKSQIHQVNDGVPFLGFKIFPFHKTVLATSQKRYRRFLNQKIALRLIGKVQPQQIEDGLNSWLGHIRFGNNYKLEQSIFRMLRDKGVNLHIHPFGSWRVLEQQTQ